MYKLFDFGLYVDAVTAFFSGGNPYLVGHEGFRFFNPIWTLFFLAPFTALGPDIGLIVLGFAGLATLTLVAKRFELNLYQTMLLCTSGLVMSNLLNGNIEWMPWLGLFLPPPLAVMFFLIKPQSTIAVIGLLLLNQWEKKGLFGVFTAILPSAILLLIQIVVYGLPAAEDVGGISNWAIFPYGLLIGVPAAYLAFSRRDFRLAAFASPFFSPHLSFHGWLPTMYSMRSVVMTIFWIISWIPLLFFERAPVPLIIYY